MVYVAKKGCVSVGGPGLKIEFLDSPPTDLEFIHGIV